jgi:hypothetical protein
MGTANTRERTLVSSDILAPETSQPAQTTNPQHIPTHVLRLECLACGSRQIGDPILCPPPCPDCGYQTMALVERLPMNESWWHILPSVSVE